MKVESQVSVWYRRRPASVAFLHSPLRELVMLIITTFTLISTSREIRKLNEFNYGPIIEVAVVFAGIFVTMIPALILLKARGGEIGITQPWHYFWVTGTISAFLDDTPSYLAFFSMAQSQPTQAASAVIGIPGNILSAISCGAVFMGALTYIGNGPNFIVKAICETHGIKTPTFLGYMAWSVTVLLPLLIILSLLFYRWSGEVAVRVMWWGKIVSAPHRNGRRRLKGRQSRFAPGWCRRPDPLRQLRMTPKAR